MTLIADVFPENRKTCLDQCRKSPVCMTETLPYFLITVNAIDFQKVSFSDIQNLKTFS